MSDTTDRQLIAEMSKLLEEVVFNDSYPNSDQYNGCDKEMCKFCADATRVLSKAKRTLKMLDEINQARQLHHP